MGLPPILQNPDATEAYQELYDSLDDAYWEASDISSKDTVHGLQTEVGEILDALVHQKLADNTAQFATLGTQIKIVNDGLKKIQDQISDITKNIATAAKVAAAITKVLSLFA